MVAKVKSGMVPAILLGVYAAFWLALAIDPKDRGAWWLENVLVFVSVPAFVWTYKKLRFSNLAYACLFVFFVFHSIGSHYTYSEVPYDAFFRQAAGFSIDQFFGFERNHYDRLVHFLYGAMLLPAVVELFAVKAPPRGTAWRILMPVLFVTSHSVLYEMIEWAAAEVFGGDLGQTYLGTQGDEWDAQKDMALATLGSCLAMAALELFRKRRA